MRDEKRSQSKEWSFVIAQNKDCGGGFFVCEFLTPKSFPKAQPGQFLMLSTNQKHLLLRRPMAFYDFSKKTFKILYSVSGKGTLALSQLKPGAILSALAPLGNSFDLNLAQHNLWLVCGGVGLAPFLFFIQATPLKYRKNITLFFGAKEKSQLSILKDFKKLNVNILCSTDQKTPKVFQGTVVDLMKLNFKEQKPQTILTCGPNPMMKRVVEVAHENGVPSFVSLEAKMGCGAGVCLSCVSSFPYLKSKHPLLCQAGPIFQTQLSL